MIRLISLSSFVVTIALTLVCSDCYFIFAEDWELDSSIPSRPVASTITVRKDGRGDTTTVQGAIDMVPVNNDKWIHIQVYPGNYVEKVTIPKTKPYIFLEGSSKDTTVIESDSHIDLSATFTSLADYFVAKGITFKNSYVSTVLIPALAIDIRGDKAEFYACGFVGLQDTICDAVGRHYFYKCYIQGAIDFIFGFGQSFYQQCTINVTLGGLNLPAYSYGYITAQGLQSATDPSGYVFSSCIVTGTLKAYLGRAYRPYARVLFIDSYMADIIEPEGWEAWKAEGNEKAVNFVEANCKGPGSDRSKRVSWAYASNFPQVEEYSTVSYINRGDWLSQLPVSD